VRRFALIGDSLPLNAPVCAETPVTRFALDTNEANMVGARKKWSKRKKNFRIAEWAEGTKYLTFS
jgi:hypothetical protein